MTAERNGDASPNGSSRAHLEGLVLQVADRIDALRSGATTPFTTFLDSLGDAELEVRRPIPLTIRPDDDSYIASFVEANISSGGETLPDAIESVQSLIASFFADVETLPDEKLGPKMRHQRRVVMEYVCRR